MKTNVKLFWGLVFPDLHKEQIEIREVKDDPAKKIFFRSLEDLNAYSPPIDKNIYFGIYTRGYKKLENGPFSGEATNCRYTRAICLDYDDLKKEKIDKSLEKNHVPTPTMIVSSGHGFHYYWVLKNKYSDLTQVVKKLVSATGADPKSKDKAHLFRVPGTNNVKDKEAKLCKIWEMNNTKYKLSHFPEQFQGGTERNIKKHFEGSILYENQNIKRHCIRKMLEGVPDGYRHFSMGRIIKYFQHKGYPQDKVRQTILDWNQRNQPLLREKDLLDSFYKYWSTNYKLLGCKIPAPTLQAKLSQFCDKGQCQMRFVGTKLDFSKSFGMNNRVFKGYSKVTGNDLLIIGILARHERGLTTSQIKMKITSKNTGKACIGRDNRRKALQKLESKGFVKKIPGNRKLGKENFYRLKKQGTFGLGYTVITNGAINGAIDGRITPKQLKIYVLLSKYGWSQIAFPSLETLSKDLRIGTSTVSKHIKKLEKADYLQRHYQITEKGAEKLVCQLLV